jgi:uncharacterized protein (DUF927 family)
LTDVDLDCSEAVGLGSYFLPPTDAIFGRASKRNSHFLYFTGIAESDDRATIQFKDPNLPKDDKNMLLEVRIGGGGRGAQSIFPGSTHEEGEEIRWETNGVPAKVEDADLMKAARWVAAASLFIRGMPGSGSRHGAFCAIGGFLARCGLTGPEVKLFAEAITAAGGFDRDHIGHAADAAEAHHSGKHSYGYKTIAEVFDEKVATKAAEWLGYKSGSDGATYGAANGGGFGSFGFNMTPTGLFFTEDPQDPKSKMFICGPFDVLANNRDDASESWGLLLHWKDSDGQAHTWPMPRELLAGDGHEVRRRLLAGGLNIASGVKPRNKLTDYLTTVNVEAKARAVASTGWYGAAFVFPDATIGVTGPEQVILQTTNSLEHGYHVRGTLDEWKQGVARLAVGNPLLMLAISTAFAASLVGPCHYESGGIHYVGRSSCGKSSTLIAAGSVWGGDPNHGFVRQWRATANGLEGTAALHNDAFLPLDDIKQANGREIGEVVYMLANNQGKRRAARDGSMRKVASWQLLFLSTGETSLAETIAKDSPSQRQTAGQQVRFIDLPCDTGVYGVFDTLHEFENARDFADHLKDAGKKYYGTACREFITKIAPVLEDTVEVVKKRVNQFVTGNCPAGSDGQVLRIATRFGLVGAAGELAIEWGILPWPKEEALAAATSCFRTWLEARGGIGAAEEADGIEAVRAFLNAHRLSRFLPAWEIEAVKEAADPDYPPKPEQRVINLAGYRRRVKVKVNDGQRPARRDDAILRLCATQMAWPVKVKVNDDDLAVNMGDEVNNDDLVVDMGDDDEDFYITDTAWKEVTAGFNRIALGRVLVERGLLVVPTGGKNLSKKERIPGIAKTQRVYHISHKIFE